MAFNESLPNKISIKPARSQEQAVELGLKILEQEKLNGAQIEINSSENDDQNF